jgi:hypothetical protein
MTRGEHDYVQRVLATIRPASIIGGNLIFLEDFESLIEHAAYASSGFSRTSTASTVYAGNSAGKLTTSTLPGASYRVAIPIAGKEIIAAEVLFHPEDIYLQDVRVEIDVKDGAFGHRAGVKLQSYTTYAAIEVINSAGTYEEVSRFAGGTFQVGWSILYLKFNLATDKYVLVQWDSNHIPLNTNDINLQASTILPLSLLTFEITRKGADNTSVDFDNLILTYEEN